jgi:hypothetical protein
VLVSQYAYNFTLGSFVSHQLAFPILVMLMLRNFLIMMIMLRNCLIMIVFRNCLIMLGGHCLIMMIMLCGHCLILLA